MNKGRQIDIMGIVNVTDDSYFAESRCGSVDAALVRIASLLDEGADIVDIGACSTRPGSVQVSESEEWVRLEPVLKAISVEFPNLKLSLDTYRSSIVRKAHDIIGQFIVNDISAGEADSEMLKTVGELGLPYVAMHMRGTPTDMQTLADYDDVTGEVLDYFGKFSIRAAANGIKDWILDPGFGFAKTISQNYTLLHELSRFSELENTDGTHPRVLVGVSRKSMIYKLLNITPEESLPATQVLHLAALQNGADILRVHDVAETVRTRELYRLL